MSVMATKREGESASAVSYLHIPAAALSPASAAAQVEALPIGAASGDVLARAALALDVAAAAAAVGRAAVGRAAVGRAAAAALLVVRAARVAGGLQAVAEDAAALGIGAGGVNLVPVNDACVATVAASDWDATDTATLLVSAASV